ncbi:hypothetical protein HK097_005939 [Rhizophlyctis rosea]|uniref:Uncharacterized protein n=1 Tax=Rhizophlyctis rosea TaxID=64517 RepID=A0AAD5SCY8_9FUNG|nr:hypothetical protein HK097_005939 [Rhizophlyctis rosea]
MRRSNEYRGPVVINVRNSSDSESTPLLYRSENRFKMLEVEMLLGILLLLEMIASAIKLFVTSSGDNKAGECAFLAASLVIADEQFQILLR